MVSNAEQQNSTPNAPDRASVLFTAFEPSGDDHASTVIRELKRMHPEVQVFAWGGPKMESAGANLIERTGEDAVMGVPGITKIIDHQRINARIEKWMGEHHVSAHVPVDSPAANFPICAIAKKRGVRVVHLVAPQIWAWGRWRIHKLRRLTDLVLCLLPFEERFFDRRRVPARFVGHMLFDEPLDFGTLDRIASAYPKGEPRIAMMPGSRPDELLRNFPLILESFRTVKERFPGAVGVVAATSEPVARHLREMAGEHGGWPNGVSIAVGNTDAVVRWCQFALVKSGTVTLQVAKQGRPMVVFYKKSNVPMYWLAKLVLSTKTFTLPNLIAGKRIVPEFVPHFAGAEPISAELLRLIEQPEVAEQQRRDQAEMVGLFAGLRASEASARAIADVLGLEKVNARAPVAPSRLTPATA